MHALADADNLATTAGPARRSTGSTRGKALAARRDEDLKQAETNHSRAIRSGRGAARRAPPQDQRGLRRSGSPRSRRAAARAPRCHRRARPAHGRPEGPGRGQGPQARREVPDSQGAGPRPPRVVLEGDGRVVARGHPPARPTRSTRSSARRPATARAGTIPAWRRARLLPQVLPPVDSPRRGHDRPQRPAGRHLVRPPADGRVRSRYHAPGAAAVPVAREPADRASRPRAAPRRLIVLQASMFRLLTSLPPGMVRFTIVDPIGIGRSFGAFMHLADFDPAMVNQQVWTDPRQIEERLADLAAHMEMVTQKYLRNEYATLEEYNAVAGEVAEPYRVVVIADFPAKIDEKAAARLAAIAAGGVPCGVLRAGRGRPLAAAAGGLLARRAAALLRAPDLGRHPPRLARRRFRPPSRSPSTGRPPAEFATREIQRVGAAAQGRARASRSPSSSSRRRSPTGGRATAGRASTCRWARPGATKRQHLTLGQGTSQHVLLAGRTGSGKSTLMHALITNIALHLQPRRDRPLPDRLQEGRRVQGLRDPRAAARQRRRDRERARVRPERPPAARRRAAPACGRVPRRGRAGHQRLPERPGLGPAAAHPARRGRVPGVLRRGGQARAGRRPLARPPGPPGPGVRHPRPARLAEPERGLQPGAEHARPDGRPDRACSAATPTPT